MSGPNEKAPGLGTGGNEAAASSCHRNQNRQGSDRGKIIPDDTDAVYKIPVVDPVADTDAALGFLRAFAPNGPWMLGAIDPENPADVKTAVFSPVVENSARKWLDERQGRLNLYYLVNETKGNRRRKEDVTAVRALHVDLDPRVGEDVEAERGRAVGLLRAYNPPPTVIVDSGNGMQGLWLLDQPVPLSGDPSPVEGRNLAIELKLGADACHDASRLMRLPGTVNVPNEKKRSRGRKAAAASVIEAHWDRVYRLDDFPWEKAPDSGSASKVEGSADPVKLSADLPRLNSLDDLPKGVSYRTKQLIVQGCDPDDPTKYPSRSEALFAVLCEMVRADCSDDQIAAVILDPDYGISAHVLEQPRPRQYAARQISRARDEAIAPELRELNDKFTVLENEGGKCRVLEFVEQPTGVRGKTRRVPSLQSFEDFRNRHMNRKVTVGKDKDGNETKTPLGKWWLEHPNRRQRHSLTFQPLEGAVVGNKLNLWEGFAVSPRQGDWSLMQAHIRDVIAGGDEVSAEYILKWLAWTVQNPDQPAEVALVLRGERGTGKGFFGREVVGLFGQHGLHTGGTELLAGRFNLHFRDCCLLFADEVVWEGDKKAEAKLKTFLTEPTLVIEGKGKDAVTWPNMLHVVISSNEDWVVPAGPYERRYAIFDVLPVHRGDHPYFEALKAELDGGGREAMLHYLLTMDLGGWHPRRDVPRTAALDDQKARGLEPVRAAVLDMLLEGAVPTAMLSFGTDEEGKPVLDVRSTNERPFVSSERIAEFINRQSRRQVTPHAVAPVMNKIGAVKSRYPRPSGWILPTLTEARQAWNDDKELPSMVWDDETDWAGVVVSGTDNEPPF